MSQDKGRPGEVQAFFWFEGGLWRWSVMPYPPAKWRNGAAEERDEAHAQWMAAFAAADAEHREERAWTEGRAVGAIR